MDTLKKNFFSTAKFSKALSFVFLKFKKCVYTTKVAHEQF